MNAEERAEYIVNSLRNSIPLIAEEIRTAQREATEKWITAVHRLLPYLPGDVTTRMKPEHVQAANGIRALIEQLEEE